MSPPFPLSDGEFLLAFSSPSSDFFGFLGAPPNALNHALKFGVADGLSDFATGLAVFSGDSTTLVGSILASSAFAALISSWISSLLALPLSSLELFNDFSLSLSFLSTLGSTTSATFSFFSSAKLCCCPKPNPSVLRTVPRLNFGLDSSVLTISEFFTSFSLLAAPPNGNSSSGLLRFCIEVSKLPFDFPGCNRSMVRFTVSRFRDPN